MANKSIFGRVVAPVVADVPEALVRNEAGGRAYQASPKYALALFAVTGTFNGTFYASGSATLDTIKLLCAQVNDLEFIAKLAVYAREHGHMKDVPAFLMAYLFAHDTKGEYYPRVFRRVIDNGKMLATFWQILRSGAVGSKRNLSASRPRRVLQQWFDSMTDHQIFRTSIGVSNPGVHDVIRAARPKPSTDSRRALYGYLSGKNPEGKEINAEALPPLVKEVEAFKKDPANSPVPDISFQLLSSMPLTTAQWTEIARKASWQTTRMNLNTFQRHGVLADEATVKLLADRLRDPAEIAKARVFPYQLMVAYLNATAELPRALREALHDAMEIAVQNLPSLDGTVVVCPDVSGSMSSAITGDRGKGATSKVRAIDVAALVSAAVLRKNPAARVIPFETGVVDVKRLRLEPRDTIITNATKLASIGGGGTNCSAPLALLNREGAKPDTVIFVSDYESWVDGSGYGRGTGMMTEWMQIVQRHPSAKLMCIDLIPRTTTQTAPRPEILNVGGFSDEVFKVLSLWTAGQLAEEAWLAHIAEVKI